MDKRIKLNLNVKEGTLRILTELIKEDDIPLGEAIDEIVFWYEYQIGKRIPPRRGINLWEEIEDELGVGRI
jgi:hypothetical protein